MKTVVYLRGLTTFISKLFSIIPGTLKICQFIEYKNTIIFIRRKFFI